MMSGILIQIKPWLTWLHLHPYWLGAAVFLIAFLECLAVVGLLVPGTVIMTAIGALIGSHVISAKMVFIPAALGAVLGDALSFWLGYSYRERLRDVWPFKFYPRLMQKGENFFYRHGGKGIFAGRFLGPIRPMLPIIAGMLNMNPARFFIADIASAVFWAPLYTLPGIILGAASTELAPETAMRLLLYVILFLLILWCVSWLIKRFIAGIFTVFHTLLDKLLKTMKHKPFLRSLYIALEDPAHPDSHSQLTLGLYFILITSLFAWIVFSVMTQGILTHENQAIFLFFRSLRNPAADHLFLLTTILGEFKFWLAVWIMLGAVFLILQVFRIAFYWGFVGLFAFGGVEFFKRLIPSMRPLGLTVTPAGHSFPSGHTTLSAAFLGFLAFIVSLQLKKSYRWMPYALAALLVFLIAVSRLYLGAHWLSDIIGGICLALCIVMFAALNYRRKILQALNLKKFLPIFLGIFILAASVFALKNYQKMQTNYQMSIPQKTLDLNAWWNKNGLGEPLYRFGRTGKPVQVFNLQWADDLQRIEHSLTAGGWQALPTKTVEVILDRLSQKSRKPEMSVLPPLYLNQRPALIMTKPLSSNSKSSLLLMLTLWDSKTYFNQNAALPLWVGNIAWRNIGQNGYFHLHDKKMPFPQLSPLNLLEQDLKNQNFSDNNGRLNKDYLFKKYSYNAEKNTLAAFNWDGNVMLIMCAPTREDK